MRISGHKKKGIIFVCCLVLLTVFSLSVFSASDAVEDDVRFPSGGWDAALLYVIEQGPHILSSDAEFEVAAPPENSSDYVLQELEYLHELAETARTDDVVARIHDENSGGEVYEYFAKEGLIAPENSDLIALLIMIDGDHEYFILREKQRFSRARPSQVSTDLETVIPDPAHPSYPSGHASQAYMVALVLSDFDPDHSAVYRRFALDIAHRREIAGVHYPSDGEAGRQLAEDVLERLREVPAFEEKFQAAKAAYVKQDLPAVPKAG